MPANCVSRVGHVESRYTEIQLATESISPQISRLATQLKILRKGFAWAVLVLFSFH